MQTTASAEFSLPFATAAVEVQTPQGTSRLTLKTAPPPPSPRVPLTLLPAWERVGAVIDQQA